MRKPRRCLCVTLSLSLSLSLAFSLFFYLPQRKIKIGQWRFLGRCPFPLRILRLSIRSPKLSCLLSCRISIKPALPAGKFLLHFARALTSLIVSQRYGVDLSIHETVEEIFLTSSFDILMKLTYRLLWRFAHRHQSTYTVCGRLSYTLFGAGLPI